MPLCYEAGDAGGFSFKLDHSLLEWGMLKVVVGGCLERMSEEKDFRVAKELAREMQCSGRTSIESARHADDWMTGAVGERLPASDKEVEITKGPPLPAVSLLVSEVLIVGGRGFP
jgi:hypothetical protein